ncbi:WG repeat-containing protein, partial [Campylobacter lari]|nr:WG repeat-containing protein [Campylobacter lari]
MNNFEEYLDLINNTKWGFIDKNGDFIIKPQYDEVRDFHNGLSVVKFNDKYGFINKNGDFIIKPQFDYIGNFKKGLAIVGYGINLFDCNAEKYGFIKENGKILIDI